MKVLKGVTNKINTETISNELIEILSKITAINDPEIQNTNILNKILAPMELKVPRIISTPLSIAINNVKSMNEDVLNSKEFKVYNNKFEMNEFAGYDIEGEINLNTITNTKNKYINKYLIFSRLKAIITGSTQSDTIPEINEAVDGYIHAFGFARGENYRDFTKINPYRNHYRAIVAPKLTSSDIINSINLIKNTNIYSGEGIIVLGHPDTIQNTIALDFNSFDGDFKKIPETHKDFLIFLDAGCTEAKENPLLIRGVDIDEKQNGLGIVSETHTLRIASGTHTLKVFPEEWYMVCRLSGVILDVNTARYTETGLMNEINTMELESWIATMNDYLKKELK